MSAQDRSVNRPAAPDEGSARFRSLEQLRAAHSDLLKRHRESGDAPALLDDVTDFIRRGRATGALLDNEADRWASQSLLDYWATTLYRVGREPPDATLAEFDPSLAPELEDSLCPYRGLDAFREEHHGLFFGRQRLVDEMLDRLESERLLAVLGPSGSGKSSAVRAGLLPALRRGALTGSREWRYYGPLVPGSSPLVNLARLFCPADADPLQEAERLRREPDHLLRWLEKKDGPAVLIVDQFEELFTLCLDQEERVGFVRALLSVIRTPQVRHRVILTMRTDFEPYVARFRLLQPLFERAQVRVTPLRPDELRETILKPAKQVGLKFETGVVDALIQDILGEPAALPLLQFTLLKLWERRERNRVTWEAYRRLGGGREALARSADAFYEGLIPEEQVTARRILLQMVQPGEGLEFTSRRIRREVLYQTGEARDRIDRVLDKLVQARLVRLTPGPALSSDQIEVAHEALVRNWRRLVEWLSQEREKLRKRRRLTAAAQEWDALGRDPGALLRGALLEEALRYRELDELGELERAYVQASQETAQAAAQRELEQARALAEAERQRAQDLRRLVLALAAVSLLALLAAAWATRQGAIAERERARADQQARLAVSRQLAAQAQNLLDERLDLALLLSLEAYETADTVEAYDSLVAGLTHAPHLVTFLGQLDGSVLSVAVSPRCLDLPQGVGCHRIVAAGGAGGELRLWDAETHQPLGEPLLAHTGTVISLAFSPDGRTLASASFDATIRLWDVATGQPLGEPLIGHQEQVRSLAFSPDGALLASASFDETIRLWDVATGEPLGEPLTGHDDGVYAVAFSPDGALLASADRGAENRSAEILLWDVGKLTLAPPGGTGEPTASEPVDREPIAALVKHERSVYDLAFSPDGETLASGGSDNTIILWDVGQLDLASSSFQEYSDPLVVQRLARHEADVFRLAFSPDGETLVSASQDTSLIVWDVATGEPIGAPLDGHGGSVYAVAFDPQGQFFVSGGGDQNVLLWQPPFNVPNASILALSPDGQTLAAGGCGLGDEENRCTQGQIQLWNLATRQPQGAPLTGHTERVYAVAFSPDGTTLASGSYDDTIILWDVASGEPLQEPWSDHREPVRSVAFSPDGRTLASGSYDETIILWDVASGRPIAEPLTDPAGSVYSVAFSPDGRTLASAGRGNEILLWDLGASPSLSQTLDGSPEEVSASVYAVTFDPEGRILASAGRDNAVTLWDVTSGETLGAPLLEHAADVYSLAFGPDGERLASGSRDSTVVLWDVASGRPIGGPFDGHRSSVGSVLFSPDGQTLISGSFDDTVIAWDIRFDPASLRARACELVGRNLTTKEWTAYFPEQPYHVSCAEWPSGEE